MWCVMGILQRKRLKHYKLAETEPSLPQVAPACTQWLDTFPFMPCTFWWMDEKYIKKSTRNWICNYNQKLLKHVTENVVLIYYWHWNGEKNLCNLNEACISKVERDKCFTVVEFSAEIVHECLKPWKCILLAPCHKHLTFSIGYLYNTTFKELVDVQVDITLLLTLIRSVLLNHFGHFLGWGDKSTTIQHTTIG